MSIGLGDVFKKICGDIRKYGDHVVVDGNKVDLKDNKTLDLSDENNLTLEFADDGKPRAKIGNISILPCGAISAPASGDAPKTENNRLQDDLGYIFTRTDLLEPQTALLNLGPQHERIIKIFRPELSASYPKDIAFLVTSATVIRFEDELLSEHRVTHLRGRLKSTGQRACMIYNLFRASILQNEVIPYLEQTRRRHRQKPDEGKVEFLDYWDSILVKGYPSAYFIKMQDRYADFSREIKWRIEDGVSSVRVFSRGVSRNEKTKRWCKEYCEENDLCYEIGSEYPLGFTPALKVLIFKRKPRTRGKD
jgi:hypothetical protein